MNAFEINRTYSPYNMAVYCREHSERSMLSALHPMLSEVDTLYGSGTASRLLTDHILALSEYLGLAVKPSGAQTTECATILVSDCPDLTLPAVMLLFRRLKNGYYAARYPLCRIQVSFSPQAVTIAARALLEEARQMRAETAENGENAVDPDDLCNVVEYLFLRLRSLNGDPVAAMLLLPPSERTGAGTYKSYRERHGADYDAFVRRLRATPQMAYDIAASNHTARLALKILNP